MHPNRIPTVHDWILLEPQSANHWLVIDRSREFLSGDGLVGRIQMMRGIYEAIGAEPGERRFFDSLDSAVGSFVPTESYGSIAS
jgi:hypothetical protein